MGAFDCIVCGSQSATHDAGNCDQHDVLANVALGPHHRRAQGVAGQIDEGPSRQDNVTTREGGMSHWLTVRGGIHVFPLLLPEVEASRLTVGPAPGVCQPRSAPHGL
jgi:hypothetical protein